MPSLEGISKARKTLNSPDNLVLGNGLGKGAGGGKPGRPNTPRRHSHDFLQFQFGLVFIFFCTALFPESPCL